MIQEELKIYKKAVMELIEKINPKTTDPSNGPRARYVWMVDGSPCDIRRYAHSYRDAIALVDRPSKEWKLYKLVHVRKLK